MRRTTIGLWVLFLFAFARPVGARPSFNPPRFRPYHVAGHHYYGGYQRGGWTGDGCAPGLASAAQVTRPTLNRIALIETDTVEFDAASNVIAIRYATDPPTWTRFPPNTAYMVEDESEVTVVGDIPPTSLE